VPPLAILVRDQICTLLFHGDFLLPSSKRPDHIINEFLYVFVASELRTFRSISAILFRTIGDRDLLSLRRNGLCPQKQCVLSMQFALAVSVCFFKGFEFLDVSRERLGRRHRNYSQFEIRMVGIVLDFFEKHLVQSEVISWFRQHSAGCKNALIKILTLRLESMLPIAETRYEIFLIEVMSWDE
jgi:hypothetical protein